jgi:hypothetical protein
MAFDAHGSVAGSPQTQPELKPQADTSASTAASSASPEVTPKAPDQSTLAASGAQASVPPVTETPPYSPNFKFTVRGKEMEIPEFLRGAIKDADVEKQVRELHEKAHGLDYVKPKFQELQETHRDLASSHQTLMGQIGELKQLYNRGDFDTFFERLNIPKQKLLQWMVAEAEYNELTPEQRQVHDARKAAEKRAWELEKQNQALESQYEQTVTSTKSTMLTFALERPEVKQFSSLLESQPGRKPGDFVAEVVQEGDYVWRASQGQVDLTPEQAIQRVMSRYSMLNASPAPQLIPGQGQADLAPKAVAEAPQPKAPVATIPKIDGRAGSSAPSRPKFRSIDDLKAHAVKLGNGG